jgi:hypothetical protein
MQVHGIILKAMHGQSAGDSPGVMAFLGVEGEWRGSGFVEGVGEHRLPFSMVKKDNPPKTEGTPLTLRHTRLATPTL